MANLKEIRTRITSVKNTQKITSAMKMVATAKLRRTQEAILATRPYAMKLQESVSALATAVDHQAHPLLRSHEPGSDGGHVHAIVVTSDRGLCGSLNSTVLRHAERFLKDRELTGRRVTLTVVGKKGSDFFKRRDFEVLNYHVDVLSAGVKFAHAREYGDFVIEKYSDGEFDEVYIFFTEFKSAINQQQRASRLLPIEEARFDESNALSEFEFEPNREELLTALLPKYVKVQIHRALLESAASEQGSRMTAMESATNNANDMIASLTLKYNRARQAAITTELVEIVSGSEALNG